MTKPIINVRDDVFDKNGANICAVIRDGIPIFTATPGTLKLFETHRELNKTFKKLPDIVTDTGSRYLNRSRSWHLRGGCRNENCKIFFRHQNNANS